MLNSARGAWFWVILCCGKSGHWRGPSGTNQPCDLGPRHHFARKGQSTALKLDRHFRVYPHSLKSGLIKTAWIATTKSGLEKRGSGYLIHTSGIGIVWDAPNGNVLGGKIWRTWASYAGTQLKPCTVVSKRYIQLTADVFLLLIIVIVVFGAPSSIRVAGKIYGISTSVKQFTIPSYRTLRLRLHYRHWSCGHRHHTSPGCSDPRQSPEAQRRYRRLLLRRIR